MAKVRAGRDLLPSSHGCMLCRLGDTYPTQHLDVTVRAYIYRWQPSRQPSACGIPNVRPLLGLCSLSNWRMCWGVEVETKARLSMTPMTPMTAVKLGTLQQHLPVAALQAALRLRHSQRAAPCFL